MDTTACQRQRQTLHAVVYPVCVCGLSYPAHQGVVFTSNPPHEYTPSRPIVDYGCISDKVVDV